MKTNTRGIAAALLLGMSLVTGCSNEEQAASSDIAIAAILEIDGVEFSACQFEAAQENIAYVKRQIAEGGTKHTRFRIKITGEDEILIGDNVEISEEQLAALVRVIAAIDRRTAVHFWWDNTSHDEFVKNVVTVCSDSGLSSVAFPNIRTEKIVKKK